MMARALDSSSLSDALNGLSSDRDVVSFSAPWTPETSGSMNFCGKEVLGYNSSASSNAGLKFSSAKMNEGVEFEGT